MITADWHFLFKFKSNSRNNRRDKCVVLAEHWDHCHNWGPLMVTAAPHVSWSHLHKYLETVRKTRRLCCGPQLPAIVITQVWILIQSDTIHNSPPGYSKFTTPTLHYYGPRMNVDINILYWGWGLKGCCLESQSELYPSNECWHQSPRPAQFSHPIFSFRSHKVLRGCRAVKASSLLSVTFVLSLEARLEDGLH